MWHRYVSWLASQLAHRWKEDTNLRSETFFAIVSTECSSHQMTTAAFSRNISKKGRTQRWSYRKWKGRFSDTNLYKITPTTQTHVHTQHPHNRHTQNTHTRTYTHKCSHLYFVDEFDIKRISADGDGNQQEVYFEVDAFANGIKGLAVDIINNLLYWTVESDIKYLNITHWETLTQTEQNNIVPETVSKGFDGAVPYSISVINSTIYWTEDREVVDQENPKITRPGAIYSTSLPTNTAQRLLQDNTLSPQDVCTFVNISGMFNCALAVYQSPLQSLILHEFGSFKVNAWGAMATIPKCISNLKSDWLN